MTTDDPSKADAEYCPVPVVRGGIVSRPGLFERLGHAPRVTQVSAPAGSGKTFLIRSWLFESGLADRAGWVTLQAGGQDAQQFWISILDALRETVPGSKLVRPLTGAPDLDGWAILERLLEDLGRLEEPLWLVIEDVYELRSAEALAQLELLLMRAPSELRFVLLTRGDVRLRLHRLRLEGELADIRAADLRFNVDEARALFKAAGVELPEPALATLVRRTEGWAAGLRLAALSLAHNPDPQRFAAEFSGSERTVAEYLLEEVLDQQSEPVRRLLLRTSVCERISGELADLLTGGSGGERILQDLEEAGAFVVALDAKRSWFRYHRLFADLLQLELRRTQPAELAPLHCAAAGWFAAHGYPVEAIRLALAAQDWSQATRLLSEHFLGLIMDGQGATAHELLAGFPADLVTADPELVVLIAIDELFRRSLGAAERHLARAKQGMTSVPADRREGFLVNLAIMRLTLAQRRGDLTAVTEEAQRLLAADESAEGALPARCQDLRALALVNLGTAELWGLRANEAERHLGQGADLARQIGRPWLEVSALASGGWAVSFRSFGLAGDRYRQAIELAREHGWADEPVVAPAYAGLGALRVWQMRLAEAEGLLEHADRALRGEVEPATGVVLHQAHGMLELAAGRDGKAMLAFEAAEQIADLLVEEHPRSTPMRAHSLQTLVRLGETGRVEQAVAGLDQPGRGETRNAIAALRLAQGDPQAATRELAPVLTGAAPVTNLGWMSQAFLLEAIARDALGDQVTAGQALEHALDLAEPDGAVFAFLLHPAPELLSRHAVHGTAHAALIAEILDLIAGNKPVAPRGEPGRPREPLSASEARILRFLPTNLSAPEIAGQLSVSVNTIRTHMRHLYEKLGVHSRTGAVEQARALGLLAHSSRRP
ncbi:MAG TPA: LuxR C-terminal-related transcriptional regulator [Trebonia sp.]|nr:LuxR C-terminal-related transcriptional regulator [Trebonia sp.]